MLIRHCRFLLFPGGIALALAAWHAAERSLPIELLRLLPPLPWLVLPLGGFISWRFNRSRLFYLLVLLAVCALLARQLPGLVPDARDLLWLLLPLNLCLIPWLKDRGACVSSLGYPVLLLCQVLLAGIVLHFDPALLGRFLAEPFWHLFHLPGSQLHSAAQFSFALALLVLGWKYWRHAGPMEGNLLTSLLLLYLSGSHWTKLPLETCLSFAGLSLTIAVIEISHSMAYRDELTGLPGRRALNENLQRLPSRYTVAMLDIDHFKKVNDRYGHDIGDQVLKMVAAKLQQAGKPGRPFRYGGEEFTLLYPGKSLDTVLPILETVRRQIAGSEFIFRQPLRPKKRPEKPKQTAKNARKLKVTLSIGVAEAGAAKAAEAVVKQADKMLYKAKQAGRNRVEH